MYTFTAYSVTNPLIVGYSRTSVLVLCTVTVQIYGIRCIRSGLLTDVSTIHVFQSIRIQIITDAWSQMRCCVCALPVLLCVVARGIRDCAMYDGESNGLRMGSGSPLRGSSTHVIHTA
jgi:hypothetical protein